MLFRQRVKVPVTSRGFPASLEGMSIRFLVTPGEFDAEALAAMDDAFDAAFEALDDPAPSRTALEVIAQRIIEAARNGERDPVRLVKAALP